MAKKQIKVVSNMPAGALGISLTNGKNHVLRKPDAFMNISEEDVWHIFNSCKTIQKGYLYIDDKAMRVELGLEDAEGVDVNALSREELKDMLDTSSPEELKEIFQADLSDGTREKIVILAREQFKANGMDAKKLKVIENETGLPIMENDGSDVQSVNDIKETKKVVPKTKSNVAK